MTLRGIFWGKPLNVTLMIPSSVKPTNAEFCHNKDRGNVFYPAVGAGRVQIYALNSDDLLNSLSVTLHTGWCVYVCLLKLYHLL